MSNLNTHDVLFINSPEFKDFQSALEHTYNFKMQTARLPEHISFTSRKVLIDTDKGTFFLKEKPLYCSGEFESKLAADFQKFISSNLNIVPKPVQTVFNDSYFVWGGRLYFLTQYLQGRVYNGSIHDLRQILEVLGTFRAVAREYISDSKPFEPFDLLVPLAYIHANTQEDGKVLKTAEKILIDLKQKYKALRPTLYAVAHGDFSIFNVLFNEGGVVALNDFDNAKKLPAVQDLAEFLVSSTLVNYVAPLSNLKHPVYVTPHTASFDTVLTYFAKLNLTPDDWARVALQAEIAWFDLLTLAVVKGDYTLRDIAPALECIGAHTLRAKIIRFFDTIN